MKLTPRLALFIGFVMSGGCSTYPEDNSDKNFLIPNQQLDVSPSLSIPVESMVAGALLFLIIDPLAPNWQIAESRLNSDRFRIVLKKKRFTTGGDGEAAQVFYRRAAQIARDQSSPGYRVIEFSEGIESTVPVAQRIAQGVIEIVR